MDEEKRRRKWFEQLISGQLDSMLKDEAFNHRRYYCPICGEKMEKEEDNEDYLTCPHCGHYMDVGEYCEQFTENAVSSGIFYEEDDD